MKNKEENSDFLNSFSDKLTEFLDMLESDLKGRFGGGEII